MTTTARFLKTKTYRRGDEEGFADADFVELYNGDYVEKVFDEPLVSVYPSEVDDTDDGASCDFRYAGNSFRATQIIGTVGGTTPHLTGKIQESTDGVTWTDVTDGGFTMVTAANDEQVIEFERSSTAHRYLRHHRTVTGTTPTFVLSVIIEALSSTVVPG